MTADQKRKWNANQARIDIALDLSAIEDAYIRLRFQAYAHAADNDIPGGDATVLLGPEADLEALDYQRLSVLAGRWNPGGKDATSKQLEREAKAVLEEGLQPPLSFLAGWVDIMRRDRGQPNGPVHATITTEVGYLRDSLNWMTATDSDGNPWWTRIERFQTELNDVRHALEQALGLTDQVDRGAPCLRCRQPLVRIWGATIDDDRWHCSRCNTWVDTTTYGLNVHDAYRQHGDWLTADDMLNEYRIPRGTLRAWAANGYVRKRRSIVAGRTHYNVTDALARRGDTPTTDDTTTTLPAMP